MHYNYIFVVCLLRLLRVRRHRKFELGDDEEEIKNDKENKQINNKTAFNMLARLLHNKHKQIQLKALNTLLQYARYKPYTLNPKP